MGAAFALIAVGGLLIGMWLRAGALAVVSVLVLAGSVVDSVIGGRDFFNAALFSIALLATLQGSYLIGLLFSNFRSVRKGSSSSLQ